MRTILITCMVGIQIFLYASETPAQAQAKWSVLPNAPVNMGNRFEDVFFVDPNLGWIISIRGEIFRTRDGGVTWTLQNMLPSGGLRSLGFANATKGWLGTLRKEDVFFTTSDGGANWIEVQNIPDPKPEGICGISVVNESVVYASGRFSGAPRVIKTNDGGQSWQTFDLSDLALALVDCYFFSPDSGFVVGAVSDDYHARILFTADGGRNWNPLFTSTRTGGLAWKISFPTRQTGYVSIEYYDPQNAVYFLKTTDGGESWEEKMLSSDWRDVQGMGFVNEKWGWQGGWDSAAYETTDGGESWQPAGFGFNINRIRFLNDTLGYAVGETVYKFSVSAPPVAVHDEKPASPENFSLAQNYPNPFLRGTKSRAAGNPSTQIRFALARSAEIVLAVYDLHGRKIKTLLAGRHPAGEYEAHWDGTNDLNEPAAAGIYIYRLQNGSSSVSKKMLFLQ